MCNETLNFSGLNSKFPVFFCGVLITKPTSQRNSIYKWMTLRLIAPAPSILFLLLSNIIIASLQFTMGVTIFTQELASPVSAARMFKALIIESGNLIPKLLPQFIKSIDTIQGDGGPGSIEQVNFTEGSHFKYVRHRIDEVDKDNLVCKYTMIEGDPLGDKLESIAYEVKFEVASDGGCICKMIRRYNALGDFESKEEEIKEGKDSAIGIYKVVESYLLENPGICI